eukprot:gnl/Chilomastix_cuspidata/3126.p1 GENE.gnl/Chilomastix_cuspidata/3126~~gnl/Chilomastix_cuspidata/3126.p1  ORF type:complete len:1172 (-),score=486.58 gnl/Chilomastix_cuspidata/3126:89-3604(-)
MGHAVSRVPVVLSFLCVTLGTFDDIFLEFYHQFRAMFDLIEINTLSELTNEYFKPTEVDMWSLVDTAEASLSAFLTQTYDHADKIAARLISLYDNDGNVAGDEREAPKMYTNADIFMNEDQAMEYNSYYEQAVSMENSFIRFSGVVPAHSVVHFPEMSWNVEDELAACAVDTIRTTNTGSACFFMLDQLDVGRVFPGIKARVLENTFLKERTWWRELYKHSNAYFLIDGTGRDSFTDHFMRELASSAYNALSDLARVAVLFFKEDFEIGPTGINPAFVYASADTNQLYIRNGPFDPFGTMGAEATLKGLASALAYIRAVNRPPSAPIPLVAEVADHFRSSVVATAAHGVSAPAFADVQPDAYGKNFALAQNYEVPIVFVFWSVPGIASDRMKTWLRAVAADLQLVFISPVLSQNTIHNVFDAQNLRSIQHTTEDSFYEHAPRLESRLMHLLDALQVTFVEAGYNRHLFSYSVLRRGVDKLLRNFVMGSDDGGGALTYSDFIMQRNIDSMASIFANGLTQMSKKIVVRNMVEPALALLRAKNGTTRPIPPIATNGGYGMVMMVSKPVYSENTGEFFAIVGIDFAAQRLINPLLFQFTTSHVCLFQKSSGLVFMFTNAEHMFDSEVKLNAIFQGDPKRVILHVSQLYPFLDTVGIWPEIYRNSHGSQFMDNDGRTRYFSWKHLSDFEDFILLFFVELGDIYAATPSGAPAQMDTLCFHQAAAAGCGEAEPSFFIPLEHFIGADDFPYGVSDTVTQTDEFAAAAEAWVNQATFEDAGDFHGLPAKLWYTIRIFSSIVGTLNTARDAAAASFAFVADMASGISVTAPAITISARNSIREFFLDTQMNTRDVQMGLRAPGKLSFLADDSKYAVFWRQVLTRRGHYELLPQLITGYALDEDTFTALVTSFFEAAAGEAYVFLLVNMFGEVVLCVEGVESDACADAAAGVHITDGFGTLAYALVKLGVLEAAADSMYSGFSDLTCTIYRMHAPLGAASEILEPGVVAFSLESEFFADEVKMYTMAEMDTVAFLMRARPKTAVSDRELTDSLPTHGCIYTEPDIFAKAATRWPTWDVLTEASHADLSQFSNPVTAPTRFTFAAHFEVSTFEVWALRTAIMAAAAFGLAWAVRVIFRDFWVNEMRKAAALSHGGLRNFLSLEQETAEESLDDSSSQSSYD